MDFGALRDLALDRCLWAHGFDVVVTRPAPDDDPIACRGMWLTQVTDDQPEGAIYGRREPRHVMVLSRLDVAAAPRGSVIVAPERMGADDLVTWIVDAHDERQADQTRLILRRANEERCE